MEEKKKIAIEGKFFMAAGFLLFVRRNSIFLYDQNFLEINKRQEHQ